MNNPINAQAMNLNPNMMLDNFKSMILTMAMVKGSSDTNSQTSIFNTILLMLLVSFIDTIVIQLKQLFQAVNMKFNSYIHKKTKDMSLINNLTLTKVKRTSIIVKVETASKNPTSDAIIDLLTHLPHTKCILLQNGVYSINYSEEIEISKGLYAKLVHNASFQSSSNSVAISSNGVEEPNIERTQNVSQTESSSPNGNDKVPFSYIDVYSYTMDMEFLQNEINNIVKNYLIKMTNKLGNNIYYFSEMPLSVYRDTSGKIDHTKMPDCLHFTMKQFVTNRSFKNLFGKEIDIVRKRVEFFRDNKDWYDNKGVPYTLGILVSGSPGSGKTSLIKCIANELKRHIINIHLSESMTKSQIENLFYSEQLHVTQNGRSETYTIPINKRIYVLEDVDCQCEIILDRGNETAEQILAKKNAELKAEIERLNFALNEISTGRKMVVTGQNMPKNEVKKDEQSNQKITLSFLLNLFDGVLETPGRITFMTTNFVDKLDKAFTRPGRIDVISKFGFADHRQLIDIVEHRYDTKLTEEQLSIIYNLHPCITPAEIGRILFENFDNLDGALNGLVSYVNEYMMREQVKKEKDNALKQKIAELEQNAEQGDLQKDEYDVKMESKGESKEEVFNNKITHNAFNNKPHNNDEYNGVSFIPLDPVKKMNLSDNPLESVIKQMEESKKQMEESKKNLQKPDWLNSVYPRADGKETKEKDNNIISEMLLKQRERERDEKQMWKNSVIEVKGFTTEIMNYSEIDSNGYTGIENNELGMENDELG